MNAIRVGIEKAYGDGFHARYIQRGIDDTVRVRLVEGPLDRASMVDAFPDFQAMRPFDQRLRFAPGEIVKQRHPEAPDLEDIGETLRGDERRRSAPFFQYRIGGDRGAVQHFGNLPAGHAMLAEDRGDTVRDAEAVVIRRRGVLRGEHGAVLAKKNDIGEGAANINADAILHACSNASSNFAILQAEIHAAADHRGSFCEAIRRIVQIETMA